MKEINNISDTQRYKIGYRITLITIIMNIILAVGKIITGLIANSTAMLADGIHTVSDIASSIGIIVGFFIAQKPKDWDHHYGHEKAESIAGFMLSLLLIAVGIKIGYSALQNIVSDDTKVPGVLALWASVISIFIKELQFRIAIHSGKKINSSALIADAWHHRSDALSSIAAFIGILGARIGYKFLDPLAGLVVSIIVVKVGIDLFIQGYNELMDTSIEKEKIYMLTEKIISQTKIKNISEIRTRRHGSKVYIDIKICVNPDIPVSKGHSIAEDVEKIVYENIENVKDVLVHVDPCEHTEENKCKECKLSTSNFVKKRE